MPRVFVVASLFAVLLPAAASALDVEGAWVRPTVPGQLGTGAFMKLSSEQPVRVVGASSPVAGVVQIHTMAMQGTTMTMRPLEGLDLPAGAAVELKPGGNHVMLMDLKRPLARGERIPVVLRIEGADHRVVEETVTVEVRDGPPAR